MCSCQTLGIIKSHQKDDASRHCSSSSANAVQCQQKVLPLSLTPAADELVHAMFYGKQSAAFQSLALKLWKAFTDYYTCYSASICHNELINGLIEWVIVTE